MSVRYICDSCEVQQCVEEADKTGWEHLVRVEDAPSPMAYVLLGRLPSDEAIHDFCPACGAIARLSMAPPPGARFHAWRSVCLTLVVLADLYVWHFLLHLFLEAW